MVQPMIERAGAILGAFLPRLLLVAGLIVGVLPGAGCGRTELDPGFTDGGGPGNLGGSGGGGGRGGSAGNAGAAGTTGAGGSSGAAGASGQAGTSGSAGTTGSAGATGAGGSGTQAPLPVACGQDACAPGIEACCVQQSSRACIDAGAPCGGGFSVGCLDGASCPVGTVCCASLLGGATSCASASVCTFAGGFPLCTSDAHCPAAAPICCRGGATGICGTRACS